MEWANKMVASGLFRQLIQAVGSSALMGGMITAEQNAIIAGSLSALAGVVLEVIHARNTRNKIKELEANQ